MKKLVIGFALVKLALVASFWFYTFSAPPSLQFAQTAPPAASPTPAAPAPEATKNRPTSDPYRGDLSIFEDPKREENLQIGRVMEILKITPGKSVADIGAGSGWFTVRAAKTVGEKGNVYAVEINPDAIKYIDERAKKENFSNIKTVLGAADDPKLPAGSIDAVLILKTYHEISEPVKVLQNLCKSLKTDALVGIIDRHGDGADHGLDEKTVVEEARKAGFALVEKHDFVKGDGMDYFLVFRAEKMLK